PPEYLRHTTQPSTLPPSLHDALPIFLYTSGTTGTPKGAVLTHGSVVGSAGAQVEHFQTGQDDVYLGVMPLNHVGGLTCTVTDVIDRKSTRLNSSHVSISYAVFCLKKK